MVGPVGAGKTALVKSLLGELEPAPRMVVDRTLESTPDSTSNNQSNNAFTTMEVPRVPMSAGTVSIIHILGHWMSQHGNVEKVFS